MTAAAGPRVVVVTLDALDSSVFERLLASGALPNLAAFATESRRASIRSDGDTLHGGIWPTFATGTGPGTHGRYFWTQWLHEEMGYVRSSHPDLAIVPFWDRLSAAGLPVTALDVPYVPLDRHPGAIHVSGWGMHDEVEHEAWPAGHLAVFRRRFGKHPLGLDTLEPQTRQDKLRMVRDLRRGVALRARAVESLLRERPGPGFSLFVFGETHKAGHYLAAPQRLSKRLTNLSAMGAILAPLDARWQSILAAAGPGAHVLLLSLHGMVEQADFSGTLGAQVLALALGKNPAVALPRRDLLRRVRDLLPGGVHRAVWRRLPPRFRAARQGHRSAAGADFAHDPVFRVAHDGHLGLRLNLAGREREGRYSRAQAEAAMERFESLARSLVTPSGEPAFDQLLRVHERFAGARADRLPDALLLANMAVPAATRVSGPGGLELQSSEPEARNGVHNGQGFLLFRPGNGQASLARPIVDNRDFAPSLLALFGLPAEGFEGAPFLP